MLMMKMKRFSEKAFIYGPLFVLPSDVPHPPNKSFYKQEILLSTTENTTEVGQITGKCAVLEHSEYISCKLEFPLRNLKYYLRLAVYNSV